jgi:hypothetical protein
MAGVALCVALLLLASGAPSTAGEILDPRSRLPDSGSASEYWDLSAHFTSGHRFFARVLVTNEGPGSRSAAAFGHIVLPDGRPVFFKNGRRKARWTLSEEGRRLQIGSTLLDQSGAVRRFQVDKKGSGIRLVLDYDGDASSAPAPEGPGGYRLHLLNLSTPVTGSVWVAEHPEELPLTGWITVTHAWMTASERSLLARRVDVTTLDESALPFFLTDLTTPDGERWQWVAISDPPGKSLPAGLGPLQFSVNFARRGTSDSAYPVPAGLELTGPDLSGSIPLGEPLLQLDPLDALPGFLKMVYSFVAQPRRIWSDAHVDLALKPEPGRAVLQIRGRGSASLTFLDSLPAQLR